MTHTMNSIPDTWIPATAKEWYQWLVREEEKTVAVYSDKPTLLVADYLRERATARDYEGLEIPELLQNASVVEDIETIKAEFATFQPDKPVEANFPVTEPPVPFVISNTSTVNLDMELLDTVSYLARRHLEKPSRPGLYPAALLEGFYYPVPFVLYLQ